MASGFYNRGATRLLSGAINGGSATWKCMLVKTTYTYNPDHDFVDDGSANDPLSHELVATNYTGGYSGSGRKTLTVTISEDDTNNRVKFVIGNVTYTALGGATNDTIGGVVVYVNETADTDSTLIAFLDVADTPTNGSDIVLTMDSSNGNLRALI